MKTEQKITEKARESSNTNTLIAKGKVVKTTKNLKAI